MGWFKKEPPQVIQGKESHVWVVRVWTNDILESKPIFSVTYNTKEEGRVLKRALRVSKEKYKVTQDRIDFDGDWIV